jgi:DNA-binding IclR family transcriptional regulator
MAAGSGDARRIQSLERMDAILDAIAMAPDGAARLVEIAAQTGLHKNTVFSLLKTLVSLGYCDQSRATQDYRLGRRAFELARIAERNLDIVTAFRPLMLRMVWLFRESLCLAVPGPEKGVVVNTVEGTYGVRGSRFHGQGIPYHAAALGKVILAFRSEADRRLILERIRFTRFTSRTIQTRADLEEDCARTRALGYAVSIAEEEVGTSAVAVPIFSRGGEIIGGLAIFGPSARLTRTKLAEYGKHLLAETRTMTGPGSDHR